MHQLHAVLALSAATVIALGLLSGGIKRSPLSVPLLALGIGVAAGPTGLGWVNPEAWSDPHQILKQAARFTVAISVTGIALRTPLGDVRSLLRPVGLLLVFGMLGMWAVSALVSWWLLGLAPLVALLLGAAVTPTDPVVASAIVTGKAAEEKLPSRLRSTLSLESGANDGLGYLIVLLPLLALTLAPDEYVLSHWLVSTLLVGVVLAVVLGAAIGLVCGWALRWARAAGVVEYHSFLSISVALSLLALAAASLVGSDGILASFAAALAFNIALDRSDDFAEENVQEAISKLFNLPVFVLLGIMLPWGAWMQLGWAGGAFAVGLLLLRRPVTIAALGPFLGAGLRMRDTVFLAWFAPVGVAALYYALHAMEQTGNPVYWHATSLAVAVSVLLHGVTATAGMALYDRAAPSRG
ncbi:cation:proton antiporter domain-containing protein [Citreimonas sp.]|uniref:cation:proton antiporter domain-containing protein n=1 Tax=Citreimonas sp. TaxID=3036715 RepID=UPI004057EADF